MGATLEASSRARCLLESKFPSLLRDELTVFDLFIIRNEIFLLSPCTVTCDVLNGPSH